MDLESKVMDSVEEVFGSEKILNLNKGVLTLEEELRSVVLTRTTQVNEDNFEARSPWRCANDSVRRISRLCAFRESSACTAFSALSQC